MFTSRKAIEVFPMAFLVSMAACSSSTTSTPLTTPNEASTLPSTECSLKLVRAERRSGSFSVDENVCQQACEKGTQEAYVAKAVMTIHGNPNPLVAGKV